MKRILLFAWVFTYFLHAMESGAEKENNHLKVVTSQALSVTKLFCLKRSPGSYNLFKDAGDTTKQQSSTYFDEHNEKCSCGSAVLSKSDRS